MGGRLVSPGADTCLGGEVAARLELLEEGRHEDGGKEEDHAPEEDVWDERAVRSTGRAHKVSVQRLALLLTPEDTVMMMMMKMVGMKEDRGGAAETKRWRCSEEDGVGGMSVVS